MLKAFLYKISSKFKTLKTNFQYKTSFIIKMSKCEVINSALEDDNNGTEESETSDDEYISDFTKLQPQIRKLGVKVISKVYFHSFLKYFYPVIY